MKYNRGGTGTVQPVDKERELMALSSVVVPSDPHLRRWMAFIDGENRAIRAAKVTAGKFALPPGEFFRPNVFVWMPKVDPARNWIGNHAPLQHNAIRAHYYTSIQGDEALVSTAREEIWKLGFDPSVFKKRDGRAKAVDIALTTDLLTHAFLDNYDVALLVAGDGDYVRAIEAVKNRGKVVYVAFFRGNESGLNPELRLAADTFFDLGPRFDRAWQEYLSQSTSPESSAPMLSARAFPPA
jgi:hypothetical protein